MRLVFALFIFFSSLSVYAVSGDNFDFNAYLRAGTGTNSKGGGQVCIQNTGAWAKEFRLGNECENFADITFTAHNRKAKEGPQWKTQFLLTQKADGFQSWESTTAGGGYEQVWREAFVEGSNLFAGNKWAFWAGKRFYRDVDSHMDDFYYFGDTSGVGAGIKNIALGFGTLALATLKNTSATTSDIGNHQVTLYDARLFNVPFLFAKSNLNFWFDYGSAAGGNDVANNKKYSNISGLVAGVRFFQGIGDGFNNFTVIYGDKMLSSFGFGNPAVLEVDKPTVDKSKIWRFVNDATFKLMDNLESHLTLIYQAKDPGTGKNEDWKSVGIRPVYFFNDVFSIALETGHSVTRSYQNNVRTSYQLTKVTLAPQLSASQGIWGRPVLRAFVSHFLWNHNNKGRIGGGAYTNNTDATTYGFQAEAWF
jgi:maltoporin